MAAARILQLYLALSESALTKKDPDWQRDGRKGKWAIRDLF
jgi:hypothetical protein